MNHNEEAIGLLNCLLEWLQQVDLKNFGSHLSLNFYADGAQHVDTIQTQYFGEYSQQLHEVPQPLTTSEKNQVDLPEALATEERIQHCIALLMGERYGDEPLFNLQSHWQAIYRILVDKGYCRDSDFEGFDAFIRWVMPEEVNKPYKKDSVRNINKTSFNKPFGKWKYDPDDYGTRKPFERMGGYRTAFQGNFGGKRPVR